jgi:hypothetical protein
MLDVSLDFLFGLPQICIITECTKFHIIPLGLLCIKERIISEIKLYRSILQTIINNRNFSNIEEDQNGNGIFFEYNDEHDML